MSLLKHCSVVVDMLDFKTPYPSNVGQVDDLETAVEVYVHGKLEVIWFHCPTQGKHKQHPP